MQNWINDIKIPSAASKKACHLSIIRKKVYYNEWNTKPVKKKRTENLRPKKLQLSFKTVLSFNYIPMWTQRQFILFSSNLFLFSIHGHWQIETYANLEFPQSNVKQSWTVTRLEFPETIALSGEADTLTEMFSEE